MKIVCYTCITGSYDALKQPITISKNIDFVCFTDNMSLRGGIWQIRPIPQELDYLSDVKKQRIVKICPHRYLPDYDVSIWIDGSMQVMQDLNCFVKQYDLDKCPLYVRVHPTRHCIYDEADACIKQMKDSEQTIRQQIEAYKAVGYPRNIGMVETGVLLRKHNDINCQTLMNMWASEILKHSHRDQLSFNYVCWKIKFIPGILKNEFNVRKNNFFNIAMHLNEKSKDSH